MRCVSARPAIFERSSYVDIRKFGGDPDALWIAFCSALRRTGLTVVGSERVAFPSDGGKGLSGVLVLAESHASIHSWPELGVGWVQIASCGAERSVELFLEGVSEAVGALLV